MPLEDLAAKLFHGDEKTEIDFCPINVSSSGFSIYTARPLPEGARLELHLNCRTVPVKVRWCKNKEGDPAVYRIGLELDEPGNLAELIAQDLLIG